MNDNRTLARWLIPLLGWRVNVYASPDPAPGIISPRYFRDKYVTVIGVWVHRWFVGISKDGAA